MDEAPMISPDGSMLYFSSNRYGGSGSDDLWQASVLPVVDFDGDRAVGLSDLLILVENWGTDEPMCDIGPMPWGDGAVDEADLEALMEHWGQSYPADAPVDTHPVVDDFESYTDTTPHVIWETWADFFVNNTGAVIGYADPPHAEVDIVHGGNQAMPFGYDNDGTVLEETEFETRGTLFYAEAQRTWEEPQDWTRDGLEILTLWFYGEPDNSVERFYVALEDNAGNRKDIPHPDPAAVTIEEWQQWRIPLADFTGVDLTKIKMMAIGTGDPASTQPGGSGLVRIDDIELHLPPGP
jgi:hypothetical protein